MKLKDVPASPAYLVFHDAYDNGAMDVYAYDNLPYAQHIANGRNNVLDQTGMDDCGIWKAYAKLPRKRVFAYHPAN